MKIQKGDLVKVISGKDSGKQGKVLQAFPKKRNGSCRGCEYNKKASKTTGSNNAGRCN